MTYEEIVKLYGEWTAMSIHLGQGRYTLMPPRPDPRLRRLVQTAADLALKPIDQLRVLDLACLEGHYAVEFALPGAQTVGIEIREANLKKALYVKEKLRLDNLQLYQDDVRNLSVEKYGRFDVVLCAGILYHLDVPDVFDLVKNVHAVCDRLAIFDTYVSLNPAIPVEYEGRRYWGLEYLEHEETATSQERRGDLWASIGNAKSFWLTRASLCNLLSRAGFSSVLECRNPAYQAGSDRITLVAIKASHARVLSSPATEESEKEDHPERPSLQAHPAQRRQGFLFKFLKSSLPQPVKSLIKPWLRTLGLLAPEFAPDWSKKAPIKK